MAPSTASRSSGSRAAEAPAEQLPRQVLAAEAQKGCFSG